MVEVNTSYPNFSSGEISPKMYGRYDLAAYYSGCRRVENFIPQVTGSANFRGGFIYSAKARENKKARLYPFYINFVTSYILEFTDQKIRFFSNDGQVRADAQGITGITNANPAVVTYSGTDTFTNGDSVVIYGVGGMTELNEKEFKIANVNAGANTFELVGVNSTSYGTYTSGGSIERIIEVTSPYLEADLFKLKFTKKGSVLYITNSGYAPRKLTYTSPTSWALTSHAAKVKVFGNSQGITAITKANPAVVTYTGSDNFSNGDKVFIAGVLGMLEINDKEYTVANVNTGANTFELQGIDSSGYSTYTSGGVIQKITLNDAPFLTAGSYPSAVTFYEQRLVYGGSVDFPNTLHFSVSGDEDDFTLGDDVDSGISYTIGGTANNITWLNGTSSFLAVGCIGDVYKVTGGVDEVITPNSISIKPTNGYGCADMMPIGRGNQIFYTQNNNLIMRSFEYDLQADGYIPVDRNTIADHITYSGITQIDFQEGRPNVLWGIKNNGELIGMTVEDTESISGWHRHKTDGEFISIASLPRDGDYHQLWACVKRNGNYYIEYMSDPVVYPRRMDYLITGNKKQDDDIFTNILFEKQKEYIHLDSALTYRGDFTDVTVTPSAVSGASVTFTAGGSFFTSGMVGREIWRKSVTGVEVGRAKIIGYTSATQVTCEILETFDSTTAIPAGEWYLTAGTVSGLEHLEGETVSIVADGGQHPQKTVTGGSVTLDRQASVVHVGLPYNGYLETNELEGGGLNGTAQTKRKSLNAVGIRFLDTLYAKFGSDYYKLEQIEQRKAYMRMDRPPEIFSGDKLQVYVNQTNDKEDGGWSRSKRVIILQDQPFPCNIQLLIPYFVVSN